MERRLRELIGEALQLGGSDLHLLMDEKMHIECRVQRRCVPLAVQPHDERLFWYLRYLSDMDCSDALHPQSGSFEMAFGTSRYGFRFAMLTSGHKMSGVLRIMNYCKPMGLERLIWRGRQRQLMKKWCQYEHGLILISGPTGSGKTTTLYALVNAMGSRKIYTLEDPIEILYESLVQIQINPHLQLSYAEGIRQLMRHDPDVVMIGEIRDGECAKMAVRCALTGHLVLSSIHAADCKGTIQRMLELGVSQSELSDVLIGIANQRLFPVYRHSGRVSLYELFDRNMIRQYLQGEDVSSHFAQEVTYAYEKGWISKEEAAKGIVGSV